MGAGGIGPASPLAYRMISEFEKQKKMYEEMRWLPEKELSRIASLYEKSGFLAQCYLALFTDQAIQEDVAKRILHERGRRAAHGKSVDSVASETDQ